MVWFSNSIYPSIYGCTALVDFGHFFTFLIYTQSVELLGKGISSSKAATYTKNNTTELKDPSVWAGENL
jgi:hypothetical protein